MVSNKTLAKVAVYGAVGCISAVMFMRHKIQERVRSADYFKEAMKIVRSHPGSKHLLGEPIREVGFDLGDQYRNYSDGKNARFEVSLKGSKQKGTVFFWAALNEENKWNVHRMELQLKDDPTKRLFIKNEEIEKDNQ